MKELLIIKFNDCYYRFHGDEYECCEMSSASVYPLSRRDEAVSRLRELERAGIHANLMKLTISEEPYSGSKED